MSNPMYGSKGHRISEDVYDNFIKPLGISDYLDYGCGKGSLTTKIKMDYGVTGVNYDPSIPVYSQRPTHVFDGVVCSDVLEHIEPHFLESVLKDILSFGKKGYYLRIALCPSNKKLPDGRNAHLIIENQTWWMTKLQGAGFKIIKELETEDDAKSKDLIFYTCVCEKQ